MMKPSVILVLASMVCISESLFHHHKRHPNVIKQTNPYLPFSTTDYPELLPDEIAPQVPVFFPERRGQASSRVFRWGDIEAFMVEGFMIPIVKPQGSPPQIPNPGPGEQTFPDGQESQDILDGSSSSDVESQAANRLGFQDTRGEDDYAVQQGIKLEMSGSDPVMCGNYQMRPGGGFTIQTPYFPNNYASSFKCKWLVTAMTGGAMLLNCPTFQLGKGDQLFITVVNQPQSLTKYTGNKGPVNQVINGTAVRLYFVSNKKKNQKGFSCTVTAMGSSTTSTTTTTTTTPKPTTTTTTVLPTTTTKTSTESTTAIMTTTTERTTTTEGPTTTAASTTTLPPLSHPDCGITNRASGRIVNGQAATPNEYPWQSFLEIKWDDGKSQLCGGSLITKQWILTAGHCVLRKRDNGQLWKPNVDVTLGMHTRTNPLENGGFKVTAAAVEIHPKNNFAFDLALIKLPEEVEYKREIRPVCLPNRNLYGRNVTGVLMALIGWGKIETGQLTTELRELSRYGIEGKICKAVFGTYITDHHFCTSGTNVKHICLGDSGGPVMTIDRSRFTLTGVVSFVATTDCKGEYPDGHISVAHFLDWIQDVTGHTIY